MAHDTSVRLGALTLTLVASACAGEGGASAGGAQPPADPAAEVLTWRVTHEADYLRDFVSIAGLHFVDSGIYRLGSDPASDIVLHNVPASIGQLVVEDGTIRFEPAPGVTLAQGGGIVTGPVVMKARGEPATEEITIGEVRLVAHESGDRLALRVRDPNGSLAAAFQGFSWFSIDPAYRVTARFVPDAQSRTIQVLNTFNDIAEYPTEGIVEFTLAGQVLRLRPFTTRPNRFYFVFRDASGGVETYKTARFLYSDLLPDGTTILDFNMAYNPPCAFNPYTTCPIPLEENILPVKILAGERAYPVEVTLPVSD